MLDFSFLVRGPSRTRIFVEAAILAALSLLPPSRAGAADAQASAGLETFKRDVVPLLEDYCFDCHGNGSAKGKVAFDELNDTDILGRTDLWLGAFKNLRTNIMPPADKPQPSPSEVKRITDWIKYAAFKIDPRSPDPGRVTIRRLNRVEYGRTLQTLLGVDFPSEAEFPPDDTGHGFDNIGDVLSVSPLLLEKYLQAAESIVSQVAPQTSRVTPVLTAFGRDFQDYDEAPNFENSEGEDGGRLARAKMGRPLSYSENSKVRHTFNVPANATYHVVFDIGIRGPFNFDAARCQLKIKIDGKDRFDEAMGWHDRKSWKLEYDETWKAGAHEVSFETIPLPPADLPAEPLPPASEETQRLEVRIASVQVQGPFDAKFRVRPANYLKFFPRGEPPVAEKDRENYARDILRDFASRAFRRPVDASALERLVHLGRSIELSGDGTFEQGVSRAMMAVLTSPRFLFRLEELEPADANEPFPRIDEYSLASRLSYFLWSTMPDKRLLALAEKGELRAHLRNEVERMLKDPQSAAFVKNFTGQWLQARDVESVPINARVVLGLPPPRRGGPKADFDSETRRAMRSETELVFDYVMRGDRSLLELIESDYTFLNDKLAKVYGIPDVTGKAMRLVKLPPTSPRGGVLTQGTVLTVTSNPTRTSPVKRGQFILENILGTPAPPAPPNIPALEDAKAAIRGHEPTLREMLARHREDTLCSSCHERMDPLGLALENFNALGNWRESEAGQRIETAGTLITGETFADIRQLKQVIAQNRKTDFYRCLTEKLLIYALGRGLDYHDVETVDTIVAKLDRDGGRFSSLLFGVIESAPFQRRRGAKAMETARLAAETSLSLATPSSDAPHP